jgi:hypothetical protein
MEKIKTKRYGLNVFVAVTAVFCISVSACSNESENTYLPLADESEFSESDVSACEFYLGSTSLLEEQQLQDFYETSVLIVRASYNSRTTAWERVLGSSNYEISALTYADDWGISSAAQDLETAYEDGLEIVGYSTDPSEIEDAITSFFDAFDSLNSVCSDASY